MTDNATTSNDRQPPNGEPADRWLTIPNLLCMVRFLGAFGLIPLALAEKPVAFIVTYVALTSTDWVDGKLARWLNQESKIGPRLDTLADVTMYGGLLFGLVWLFGSTLAKEWILIGLAVCSYALSCLASLVKFQHIPSYHTRAAKISWLLVLLGTAALFADWSIWPLRVAGVAILFTNLEALLITLLLPQRLEDVASLWHALRRMPDQSGS